MRRILLVCVVAACGPKHSDNSASAWADFDCRDRMASYDVVGGMAGEESGVTLDCNKHGPTVTRWVEAKDGTRDEASANVSPGTFNDVWIRIDGVGWQNLDDCAPDTGADVPVYRFDVTKDDNQKSIECDSVDPPFPYNTFVDELNQLAATIPGDKGKSEMDIDDSDLGDDQ